MGTTVNQNNVAVADKPADKKAAAHGKKIEHQRGTIAEWTVTILLLLFGTTTLVQAFVIPTGSMEDTLLVGDHLLVDKLKPYHVPVAYYYYTEDPNVTIDITEVFEDKAKAAAAHVSQFEPSLNKYTPEMSEETFAGIRDWAAGFSEEDGKMVERFRRVEWP